MEVKDVIFKCTQPQENVHIAIQSSYSSKGKIVAFYLYFWIISYASPEQFGSKFGQILLHISQGIFFSWKAAQNPCLLAVFLFQIHNLNIPAWIYTYIHYFICFPPTLLVYCQTSLLYFIIIQFSFTSGQFFSLFHCIWEYAKPSFEHILSKRLLL